MTEFEWLLHRLEAGISGGILEESLAAIKQLQAELNSCRRDAALVIHALDCALQLVEMLIAFTPEGSPLHPNIATAKDALDRAMAAIRGRK